MGVRASYHTRTMHQHFSASVPHRCDCATTSSLIFEAVMRATSFLHPTTMIQALSAHRGAHTEKIVRIYLGLSGWEHTTHSGLGGAPCSLRPFELCELTASTARPTMWVVPCSRLRLHPIGRRSSAAPLNSRSPRPVKK